VDECECFYAISKKKFEILIFEKNG